MIERVHELTGGCLSIILKVVGGQCDNAITFGSRCEERKPSDKYEKNEIIGRRARSAISISNRSSHLCCPRGIYTHTHRVLMSRISLMQMRTIPTVMSGITFKFIGSY